MEWVEFGDYKVEKKVKDEIHIIKVIHKNLQEFGVCITTLCELPSKKSFNNVGEFTELNRQDAINLYYILNRSSMYMDNIV